MNFRKDINALRAFAVAAVVLFHFGVAGIEGGFVGVDVFFVISGYLMTGIIYRRLDRQVFSVWEFYLDRARRILPALCVMCGSLLLVGWLFLFPSDYKALAKYAVSAVTFLSNIAFIRDAGYFDTVPTEKWLLHTWSLSVEWQFYLVYPLVLVALRRWVGRTPSSRWLAGIGLMSFALSVALSENSPAAAFYLLPTRAWEMIAGGLVFLYPVPYGSRSRIAAEWGGLALIIGACALFSPTDVWPGWLAAIPVLGTALVISATNTHSRFMGNPFVQFLGRSSYSIYLWHWPIVVGLNYFGKNQEAGWVAAAILLSVLLGWMSMRYVENVMHHPGSEPALGRSASNQGFLAAISGVTVAIGAIVFFLQGVPQSFRSINEGERSKFVESYAKMHKTGLVEPYRAECDFYDWDRKTAKSMISPSCTGTSGDQSVFIWGDSHAQALSEGIRNLLPATATVAQVATSGCTPTLGPEAIASTIPNNCDKSNAFALAEIARLRPQTVLIAQRRYHEQTDWGVLADHLHQIGVKNVVLVGPLPAWMPSLPSIVARTHWFDRSAYVSNGLDKTLFATDRILRQLWSKSTRLTYVSMVEKLCSRESCLGIVPGSERVLMAVDYAHLTADGSRYAAEIALRAPLSAWHELRQVP